MSEWTIVKVKMSNGDFVIFHENEQGEERQTRHTAEGKAMLHFMAMGESYDKAKEMIWRAKR